ncbi:MAG: hypothetical protein A2901_02860 [Elusimicrobia bacterium RIFCSPLOWO2_01_FULL_54_10]|nr:MAG: hypothetical protein A2901_02860 [Elusimicrobia bacterium RIFCSPLOWO2_01_FULL_54_10]
MIDFFLIAALWGGSFLFMRQAVPEFGPIALIAVRVLIASLFLLPFVLVQRGTADLRGNLRKIFFLGVFNYALPFCLLAYTTRHVTAGFASIINSTAPLFTALVGWVWLKNKLTPVQLIGIILGFGGVLILSWGNISFKPEGGALAVVAGLAATFCYGIATIYTKEKLQGIPPLPLTAWGLASAAVLLAPLLFFVYPATTPSPGAWHAVVMLGLLSTSLAFILFFRLLARWGATRAIAVGFLIPVFGVLWGRIFLGEPITLQMLLGGAVILLGTALTLEFLGILKSSSTKQL